MEPNAVSEQALKYALLMSNPEFQKLVQGMVASGAQKKLYISEAALALGLYLFRTWKGRSIQTMLGRIGFQLWTLVVYLGLSGYVLPRFWFGPDFDRLLGMLKPVLPPWLAPLWPWA